MPDFGNPAGLAAALARLVTSPRVQYGVNQLKNQVIPNIGGPFVTTPPNMRGASPIQRNSPRSASGAGNAFGSGIGSFLSALNGQGQQQQQDPMQALYAQLLQQLQSPVASPSGINTEDLMNQVKRAINPIYDARAQTAKNQTSRATKDVQGMYGALSQDYKELAPEQAAQAAAAKEEIEGLYGQLRSNIEGTYSRVSSEQGELFKQLGIESALPEVLSDQNPAVTDALTAASENESQQQQRYMDIGQMDESYYRQGAPNAVLAGNEISSGMLSELSNVLNQIEGERSSGIQSGYMDQLGQAQSNLAQQQQSAQSEAARRQGMLWEMLQSQMQSGNQQQQMTPDSYMQSLSPQTQQSVAGAFTQLQRSPEATYGKVEDKRNPVPGSFVETTPEWYLSQADAMYQSGQIDAQTHQDLLMYLQLYFKMGQ